MVFVGCSRVWFSMFSAFYSVYFCFLGLSFLCRFSFSFGVAWRVRVCFVSVIFASRLFWGLFGFILLGLGVCFLGSLGYRVVFCLRFCG